MLTNQDKMKKLLFIAPAYMNLYKDIIAELTNKGYSVDFIAEKSYKDDPLNIRGYRKHSRLLVNAEKFEKKISAIWKNTLNSNEYNKAYDVLFVLDGQSLHPCIFDILKSRNPQLKAVNYLFDTTIGIYQFEKNFKYFDSVFSFDKSDVEKYNLNFLPIYWPQEDAKPHEHYNVFGFGAINVPRYELFKGIKKICDECKYSYFLKLFVFFNVRNEKLYELQHRFLRLFGKSKGYIPVEAINSSFATKETIDPAEFRQYILNSDVVIDSSAPHQDGLTARFMWALGAEKKIITTNNTVDKYPFYTKDQIFIYNDSGANNSLADFITSNYKMSEDIREIVADYRLDNWLDRILK